MCMHFQLSLFFNVWLLFRTTWNKFVQNNKHHPNLKYWELVILSKVIFTNILDYPIGQFWPDLEISEAYLMGLLVSSSGDFVSWNLKEKNRVS